MMRNNQKNKKYICYPIPAVEYLNAWIQSHPNLTWSELNSDQKAEMMTKTELSTYQLINWIHEHCSRCQEE